MMEKGWFLLVLLVNAVIVILYLLFSFLYRKDSSRGCILRSIVMLLCPVVGVGYFFMSWLMFRIVFHKEVDLSDVVFSKDRIKSIAKANEEQERNFVPLEEAIAVTDKKHLRELMLNVVRGNIQESLSSIALSLNSEDSETSHYAASVLQGALNDFRTKVQRDYQAVLKQAEEAAEQTAEQEGTDPNEERERFATVLIGYMDATLRKKVFTDLEQRHYTLMMNEVGELLYGVEKEHIEAETLESLALRLLEIKEYEKCRKWCMRLEALYPETLSTFTCQLKLYFSIEDREAFFRTLDALKHSKISIDRETLDLIRVFS